MLYLKILLSIKGENGPNLHFLTLQAESDGNFNEAGNEDYVAHEYSELLPQRADDEQSNQEKQREEPQVTSVNGRESNVRDAVCAESVSQSTSLESGDPQPVTFETDNQKAPVQST